MIKMLKSNHNVTAVTDTPFMTPSDLYEISVALPNHYNIGNITYTPGTGTGTTATLVIECEHISESHK